MSLKVVIAILALVSSGCYYPATPVAKESPALEIEEPELFEIPAQDINATASTSEIATEAGIDQNSVQLAFTFGERYGIHGETLVSLWLKETNCGRYMGRHKPADTMKAADWAAFKKICQRVGRDPNKQVCSPAGAIGLTQFMPKMWLHYGVDADSDGIANPWSVADALASSANFLKDHQYSQTPWSAVCSYNGGPKCRILSVQQYTNVVLRRAARWGAPLDL